MFAGAAREVVFSNCEVVRRVNEEFIPVALKAEHINFPPRGIEGKLHAEIARSKPAPQGICTVNSDGKVLAWALSFDDNESILEFLDHVKTRFEQSESTPESLVAERFHKFPSRKLADVQDNGKLLVVPPHHGSDRCPATPAVEAGTLVGRIIGRPLDVKGNPIPQTLRQEEYMEARFEVPVFAQRRLATAVKRAGRSRFRLPDQFSRPLVTSAFLGQLDVNPLAGVPGSRNDSQRIEFTGQAVDSDDSAIVRLRIDGESDVEGGHTRGVRGPDLRNDGRMWEHRVTLNWQGYADIHDDRVIRLTVIADGHERLRWGNANLIATVEPAASHLMAGHPINLNGPVRYGLTATPAAPEEVVHGAVARSEDPASKDGVKPSR